MTVFSSLQKICNPEPWSEELIKAQIKTGITLLAEHEGMPVGFLFARYLNPEIEIQDIGIVPDFRRNGAAKMLMQSLFAQFPEADCTLEVRSKNLDAIALYRSQGFKEVGRRRAYYNVPLDDAIVFTREKSSVF